MEERLATPLGGYGLSESAPEQSLSHETIVNLDDYRLQKKLEVLKEIAGAAWKMCDEDTLSCKLIDFYEEDSSDYTLKFALYDRGFPASENKVSNHRGWSGRPESRRIIIASYSHASGETSAAELHPRNFKYVESDLRSKRRLDETHDKQMEALDDMLQADYNVYD